VYDEDGSFVAEGRYHPEFVDAEGFAGCEEDSRAALKALVSTHAEVAASGLAAAMLGDWEAAAGKFVRLTPRPQV
jgi:glutamate synthase (ferredoxin)